MYANLLRVRRASENKGTLPGNSASFIERTGAAMTVGMMN